MFITLVIDYKILSFCFNRLRSWVLNYSNWFRGKGSFALLNSSLALGSASYNLLLLFWLGNIFFKWRIFILNFKRSCGNHIFPVYILIMYLWNPIRKTRPIKIHHGGVSSNGAISTTHIFKFAKSLSGILSIYRAAISIIWIYIYWARCRILVAKYLFDI